MLYFSKTDSGAILNRFSQDLQLIDMELPVAAINAFVSKSSSKILIVYQASVGGGGSYL